MFTNPAAGVIITKPTTAPIHASMTLILCPLIPSITNHVIIHIADAVFVVANAKTGEEIFTKKFYKADLGDIWRDPEYQEYVDALLEHALVRKLESNDAIDFDSESLVEVEALAEDLGMQDDLGLI